MIDRVFFRRLGFASALILAWTCMPAKAQAADLTALASFNGTNGAGPHASVTFDNNGNLFGTASSGGTGNLGGVWELAKGNSTITPLASFNGTNGESPYGSVTFVNNGNLFGTAVTGGANSQGTVWELAKGSSTITALASFNGTNGLNPYGGVTFDANGNLFGTAFGGGTGNLGVVWELAKNSSTITALGLFNGTNGLNPYGGVTFDAQGNLFGTTQFGGTSNNGVVWELAKGSSTITALASFNGTNGANPFGGVTFDNNGNLFGTAFTGGTTSQGTVWELAKGSSTITALASFNGTNGSLPRAGVTIDANGNLFGTASEGGINNQGTLWELAKGSSTITALDLFNGISGASPIGGVTLDTNGNLFGTATAGGSADQGTVWVLQTSTPAVPEPSSLVLGFIAVVLMPIVLRRFV
jgi:uncharacterized repeat protein (TIGR03803 family)